MLYTGFLDSLAKMTNRHHHDSNHHHPEPWYDTPDGFVEFLKHESRLDAPQREAALARAVGVLDDEPRQIIDLGSGVGSDATMLAGRFPTAQVRALDISDVLLPISPFSETSGTYVNAEARVQSFHAVVGPLGATRPAWKVLRVLGDLLQIGAPDYQSSEEVRHEALGGADVEFIAQDKLGNHSDAAPDLSEQPVTLDPIGIYQLDGVVRRAPSLQLTTDGKEGVSA